jgi:hypothetical protein
VSLWVWKVISKEKWLNTLAVKYMCQLSYLPQLRSWCYSIWVARSLEVGKKKKKKKKKKKEQVFLGNPGGAGHTPERLRSMFWFLKNG